VKVLAYLTRGSCDNDYTIFEAHMSLPESHKGFIGLAARDCKSQDQHSTNRSKDRMVATRLLGIFNVVSHPLQSNVGRQLLLEARAQRML
jgi:hypothetical protein